jgi:hypothetical protein
MTPKELKEALRNPYAWPGGYPTFFVTSDCSALSHRAVRENYREVLRALREGDKTSGWHIDCCIVNWEGSFLGNNQYEPLYCEHTGDIIPSAYGDDHDLQRTHQRTA